MMRDFRYVAGFDEVGRGCLAGPVIVAAVIFEAGVPPPSGLIDSKLLSAKRRRDLAMRIEQNALAWSIGRAEVNEIDNLNILKATLLAMQRAFSNLQPRPTEALIDGKQIPKLQCLSRAIIRGDQLIPEISAASILAKVWRDREMMVIDQLFPGYGLLSNKGYPSPEHIKALQKLGPSSIHRVSFAPVRFFDQSLRLT